jgi:hypothetical protein
MDAKRPELGFNHADIFQPYIVAWGFEHTYNLTPRELAHIKWYTDQRTVVEGMKLVTTVGSFFRAFWYRKLTAPGTLPMAFTQREIEILMNQKNIDMI